MAYPTQDTRGFNPAVPEQQDPYYLNLAKGITTPKLTSASAELIKGGGEIFKDSVNVADTIVKASIDDQTRKDVDATRDAEIAKLDADKQRLAQGQVPGRVTTQGVPVESLTDTNDPDKTPENVKSFDTKAENLDAARASGKYSKTYLDMQYDALLKDYRARFPGYADYIDKRFEALTGEIPANAVVKGLLGDINSYITAANTQKNSVLNKLLSNLEFDGAPEMVERFRSGQASSLEAETFLNKNLRQKYIYEMRNLQRSDAKGTREERGTQAADDLTQFGNQQFIDDSARWTSGSNLSERFEANSQDATLLAAEAQQRKLQVESKMRKWASMPDQDGVTPYQKMGPEEFNKRTEAVTKFYDKITENLTNKEYGRAHLSMILADKMGQDERFLMSKDKDIGKMMRMLDAVKNSGGPDAVKSLIDTMMIGDMPAKFRAYFTKKALDVSTGEQTTKEAVTEAQQRDVDSPKFYQKLIGQIEGITNPKIGIEQKKIWADATFSPKGIGLIARLEKDGINPITGERTSGQFSMYDRLASKEMSDAMYSLGGRHWTAYTDWAKNTFVNELLKPRLLALKDVEIPDRLSFGYDDKNHRFTVKDTSGRDILLTGSSGQTLLSPYTKATLTNINSALTRLSHIASKEQGDMNSNLLGYIVEAGSDLNVGKRNMPEGLPEQILSSIINTKKAKAEEEAKAESLKAKYKKQK